MVVDVITYNGEQELFDLRYNILKDYVDQFIVVESTETFSGREKPLYFKRIKYNYDKVFYVINEGNYTKEEIDLAESSPNTKGAEHWKREFMQKERIKLAINHLKDDDFIFIGDCDEIWQPNQFYPELGKLKLRVYTYYLNNRSSEQFWGTLVGKYKNIKNECLNHLRSSCPIKSETYLGWHFTSMAHQLRQKLTDSYTAESYATPEVLELLEENIKKRRDFLGRDFTYEIDESEWPQYLKENKEKYKNLLYAKKPRRNTKKA